MSDYLKVLKELEEGNKRFVKGKPKNSSAASAKKKELVSGQNPKAIVITCSDSRVVPEFIFDQSLGDLFVIRVAGNVLNADNIASIEYAVDHLRTSVIIFLAHESCGAVKSAINQPKGETSGSESLDSLLKKIRGNIINAGGNLDVPKDKEYKDAAVYNMSSEIQRLLDESDVVSSCYDCEEVIIVPAYYSLTIGEVEVMPIEEE